MKGPIVDKRVMTGALLATLLLWALSLGSGAAASPHRANQTIPTFTPTGQASLTPQPTTPGTTPPPTTPGTTPPPVTPVETVPAPTVTRTPSATATLGPGETAPAATPTQTPGTTEPAGSPPPPAGATPTPSPLPAGTLQPGEPAGSATASAAEPSSAPAIQGSPPAGGLPSMAATQAPDQNEPTSAAGGRQDAAAGSVLLSPPCMWLSLGLVLMAMGIALLLGRRRRQRADP